MKRALGTLFAGLGLALAGTSCAGERGDALEVYAASSLQVALAEIHDSFTRVHGVEIHMNNGGSGTLAVQIEKGGRCDVFFSAGDAEMDRLGALGLVDEMSRVELLSNQLVVVRPKDTDGVERAADLEGGAVRRLSIANPDAVPAGRYARAWLRDAGLWGAVEDRVLPAVNVRAALAAVESGGAEAGIVYRTDAARSDAVEVAQVVPIEDAPEIRYPVAAMLARPNADLARTYIAYLQSEASLDVFRRHGFLVPADD